MSRMPRAPRAPLNSKFTVIEEVMRSLLEAEKRRVQNWIDRLVQKNQEAYQNPNLWGFLYRGVYYRSSALENRSQNEKPALHSSLSEEMDSLLRGVEEIKQDKDFVRQTVKILIDDCNDSQDIRNALPDCLVSILPSLSPFPRTAEPAYTIKNNPRAMKQYEKMLPKIELYSATKMFY